MAQEPTHVTHPAPPVQREKLRAMEACFECVKHCEMCAGACLSTPDMMEMTSECVRRCRDCADVCSLCAAMLARGSDLFVVVCALCAAACERCAEECTRHEHEPCQQCAAACRRCGEACRESAQVLAGAAG